MKATPVMLKFVEGLNKKFGTESDEFGYNFSLDLKGSKFARIVLEPNFGRNNRSVYAFMDVDGNLFKAATWKAPAKIARFHITEDNVSNIVDIADQFGSFLYLR